MIKTGTPLVIVAMMMQQVLLAERAFAIGWIAVAAWLMMAISCWYAGRRPARLDSVYLAPSTSIVRRFRFSAGWLVAAIVLVACFWLGTPADRSPVIGFARSLTIAIMVAQPIIVLTRGYARLELLVAAVAVQLLSLVCTSSGIAVYRQVAEACTGICLFALMSEVVAAESSPAIQIGSRTKLRSAVVVVLLLLVVLLTRPVATAADGWVTDLQLRLDQALFESAIETRVGVASHRRYVDTASLNDVVEQFDDDPKGLAIQVFSDFQPGYLRGRVFDQYRDGAWVRTRTTENAAARGMTLQPSPTSDSPHWPSRSPTRNDRRAKPKRTFTLIAPGDGNARTLEVQNNPARGPFYFAPLRTAQIVGDGTRLTVDVHAIPVGELNTKETYLAIVWQTQPRVELAANLRRSLLQLPPSCPDIIVRKAAELRGPATSAVSIARRISEHFQQSYEYSTERREIVDDEDPLAFFLRTKHAAHCEYFASATTLMLRSLGIPARYVTGYVVDEASDESDSWLGRNLDAHAWVEAFDDDAGRWFVVESTPGRKYSSFEFAESMNTENNTAVSTGGNDGEWWLDRFSWFLLARQGKWSELLVEMSETCRWPLVLLTAALTWQLWRTRARNLFDERDPFAAVYRSILSAVDRKTKRLGIVRRKNETLHQFASRLESHAELQPSVRADAGRRLALQYRDYAHSRYRGMPPGKNEPNALASGLTESVARG